MKGTKKMDCNRLLVMSGDTVTAEWQDNKLTVLNNELLPLFLSRFSNVEMWLQTRAIDSHRANSRLLKKALRLTERDDISSVIHVNGATITDNYWVKPFGSPLKYEDVKFSDDYFSTLARKGDYNSFNRAANSKRTTTDIQTISVCCATQKPASSCPLRRILTTTWH